jgi:hypothetical protein
LITGLLSSRRFESEPKNAGAGGYRGMWLMYHATDKNSKEPVCIHILHKSKLPKFMREDEFFELMKREAQQLTRLRHPHMLRLLHPLDESRSALVLVSEPLIGSLANATGATRRPREYEVELEKKDQADFGMFK